MPTAHLKVALTAIAILMLGACAGDDDDTNTATSSSATAAASDSSSSATPTTAASASTVSAAPTAEATSAAPSGEVATSSSAAAGATLALADRIAKKVSAGGPVNIVLNNQGTGIPVFGAQQKLGVKKACAEAQAVIKSECRVTGPVSTNQSQQLAELETLLTSGQVDCLGVQSPEPNAFVNIINKYIDAGIPVFTENTDVPNSKRLAFFALNEKQAGELNGKATGELVKASGQAPETVAVGSGNPNGPWAKDRMAGFIAGFKQVFPDAKFFNTDANGLPTGDNFTTQEVIDAVGPFLQANKTVNLFFHTDQGVEGVSKVIEAKKLTGKVRASGFNVSGPILDGVESGRILVTVDQGFDNQAGAVVKACSEFLAQGKLPADPLAYLEPILVTKDGAGGTQSVADARKRLADASK